ncbi:MAG: APA family basic amino acid/polyamine antiporter [Myxococcota bacterium]|jgi:APA family basic amino acid/polyamine antiporter
MLADMAANESAQSSAPRGRHGVWSGTGLVLASMIGVGVLTSNGYMLGALPTRLVFLVWLSQAVVAACGAIAYGAIAARLPRSGGEYRYLSDLLHPALGYVAGWTSLLLGFAAPVAANAYAAGAFANQLFGGLDPVITGAVFIAAVTAFQAVDLGVAKWTQGALVIAKVTLFAGLLGIGILVGSHTLPESVTPQTHAGFPMELFAVNFFFAAYAFSGWNAAIYVAEEFEHPRRDVPRAMVRGLAGATLLYLAITWFFATNLSAEALSGWSEDKATVAHVVVRELLGESAAAIVSAGIVLVLLSSTTALMLLGPRVNAVMAADGLLPAIFRGKPGRPPSLAIVAQGVVALILLFTHGFDELLRNIGALLTVMSALTVLGLLKLGLTQGGVPRKAMAAAAIFLTASVWMLWFAAKMDASILTWIGVVLGAGLAGYAVTRALRKSPDR